MEYKILSLVKETEGGNLRNILTIQVTYSDSSTSEHGFVLEPGEEELDITEVAVKYSAKL